MRRLPIAFWTVLLAGCAAAAQSRGALASAGAAHALPFRADRQVTWAQFRLGGGLNVVVVNPHLPAAPRWRFSGARKGTSASPVVAGTTLLLPCNDRTLYALDAATGRRLWSWRTDNELMSSPVYENGSVIVGAGNAFNIVLVPPVYTIMGAGHSHLDAISLRSGAPIWRYELNGTGMPSPALSGGELIDFDGSGVVKAIDARTGRFRWRRLLYSAGTMSNVLLGDRGIFYISGLWPNAVYALRSANGSTIWRHRFSDHLNAISDAPLARAAGRLVSMYLAPRSRNPHASAVWMRSAVQHVYALDQRSGRLLWDTRLRNVHGVIPAWNEAAIPLVARATVYDGSAIAPIVTALDLATGRVRWQLRVAGPVKGGLADRDGVLYFGDLGGFLWAVDDATGRVLGKIKTDVSFNVGSPIIVNGSLVIGSHQGPVIAVPLRAIRTSRSIPGVTVSGWRLPVVGLGGAAAAILLLAVLGGVRARANRASPDA